MMLRRLNISWMRLLVLVGVVHSLSSLLVLWRFLRLSVSAVPESESITDYLSLFSNTGPPPPESYTTSDGTVSFFANNGYAKAFDTMQYPMGYNLDNVTYIVYQGPHEDPYIVEYNHETSMWKGPFRCGTNLMGHDPDPIAMREDRSVASHVKKVQADNHGKPSMVIDDEGYLHVSFGAHGGDRKLKEKLGDNKYGDYSKGKQTHVRSLRPRDISTWVEQVDSHLDWNGCYAQFIKVRSDLYHFVRHGAHVSCWSYQRSIDNGVSFLPSVPILLTKENVKNDRVMDSWYCRFRQGTGLKANFIQAVCIYHKHWKPPKHNLEAHNGYFMELNTITQEWTNVHERVVSDEFPLSKERADELIKVFDTEESEEFPFLYISPGSVANDELGRPHLLYKISVAGSTETSKVGRGSNKLFYLRWTGTKWTHPLAVTGPLKTPQSKANEDGDLVVWNSTHIQVTFSQGSQLARWESTDGGSTWRRQKVLLELSSESLGNSAYIRHSHSRALILGYSKKAADEQDPYRKLYLVGENGPIRRSVTDADVCRPQPVNDTGGVYCVPAKNSKVV